MALFTQSFFGKSKAQFAAKTFMVIAATFVTVSVSAQSPSQNQFKKLKVDKVVSAKISQQLISKDKYSADVRITATLKVEGNLHECSLKNIASQLDNRFFEEGGGRKYLNVVSTSCPKLSPLTSNNIAYPDFSNPTEISVDFDLRLYNAEADTVFVKTGYREESLSLITVGFEEGKIHVNVQN